MDETRESLTMKMLSEAASRLDFERHCLISNANPALRWSGHVAYDISDDPSRWGSWDPVGRKIAVSKRLVLGHPWNVVVGVLGHEVAHMLVTDLRPSAEFRETPHGPAFQEMCERLRLNPVYRRANVDLAESGPPPTIFNRMDPDVPSHPVLEKVRKLLALASSPEPHEAAQALAMASRLMARHNIDAAELGRSEGQDFERWLIPLESARLSRRDTLIGAILSDHFFVKVVFSWEYDFKAMRSLRRIELLGRPVNLHMARHVFYFLKERAETIWRAQKPALAAKGEKGLGAKSAFVSGMLLSFRDKLKSAEKVPFQGEVLPESSLILARDSRLERFYNEVYPHLRTFRLQSSAYAPNAAAAGAEAGRALSIFAPVASPQAGGGGGGHLEYRGGR